MQWRSFRNLAGLAMAALALGPGLVAAPQDTTDAGTAAPAARRPGQVTGQITSLIADLADEDRCHAAQIALVRLGAPAAAPVAAALATGWRTDPRGARARAAAARVLQEVGARGATAFPALWGAVHDEHAPDDVPYHAGNLIGLIGPFAGAAADRLREAMTSNGGDLHGLGLRRTALQGLHTAHALMTVDGARADLDTLLDGLDPSVQPYATATACRALAARAAEFSGAPRERVIAALRELILRPYQPGHDWRYVIDQRPYVTTPSETLVTWLRTQASLALVEFDADSPEALLGHCQRLFALDPAEQRRAADQLGRLGLIDAARWLLDLAGDTAADPGARRTALDALERLGPRVAPWAGRLYPLQDAEDPLLAATARRVFRAVTPHYSPPGDARGELLICASGIPLAGGLDTTDERARLTAWLDADGGSVRHRLQINPRLIDQFHALGREQGGPLSVRCRWAVLHTGPDPWRPGHWRKRAAERMTHVVLGSPAGSVDASGRRLRDLPWLVELVLTDQDGPLLPDDAFDRLYRTSTNPPRYTARLQTDFVDDWFEIRTSAGDRSEAVLFVVDGLCVATSWFTPSDMFAPRAGTLSFTVMPAAADRVPRLDALQR